MRLTRSKPKELPKIEEQPAEPFDEPQLTGAQERVLDELRGRGIATVSFDELVGDATLWGELQADMDAFVERAVEEVPASLTRPEHKDQFLIRRFRPNKQGEALEEARLATDGPWLRFAVGSPLLDVVNTYRRLQTKLVDYDHWYTVPFSEDYKRVASQQWHRDPEDLHVVKAFLYFTDVDEESGPFEYVPGSTEGGPYGDLFPWGEGDSWYPSVRKFDRKVPQSARVVATAPAGTIVLCDTSGFHRGGHARSKPRILSTHTYVSQGSTWGRRFEVDWRDGDLSDAARFALS
jgi:Phytanoyl-CoA dioxygenase (PhyH)